jgi:RNA polymerase sigma-70 factor (ECF subfamily)
MYREVLVLRDVEGLTAPEVAEVMGLSVEAVKSRLHRARVAVREAVAPVLGVPGAEEAPAGVSCPDILQLFSRHIEGEISASVCADMERHLEGCPACRSRCDSLQTTLALCKNTSLPEVPKTVQASVRTALRKLIALHDGAP